VSLVIGQYEGAQVEMEWREGRQVIIVRLPKQLSMADAVMGTALGLILGQADVGAQGDEVVYEIEHDAQVDQRMVALIDLLAELRYRHPQATQLELALPVEVAP